MRVSLATKNIVGGTIFMQEIQIFNNPEFGDIRTVTIDGEPWFVSVDVAKALGYKKTVNMTKLVDDEDKRNISSSVLEEQVYKQNYTLGTINESGLYAAIFGSKQENAKKFKKWVTSEVLPSIRKTGGYGQPQLPDNPMELLEIHYQALKQVDSKVDVVSAEVQTVKQDLEKFKADVPAFNADTKDIQNALRKKAIEVLGGKESNAYNDNSVRGYAFADIQIELRRQFGVKRYDQIKHKDVKVALRIIEEYKPPIHIKNKIEMANAQQSLDLK